MKRVLITSIFSFIIILFTSAFQCSSPELTSTRLYINQNNFEAAEKSAEKEVANNPKSTEGWFLLGRIKFEKEDFIAMKEAFDKASELDVAAKYKNDIYIMTMNGWVKSYNKGVSFYNEGNDTKSNEAYDKAIQAFNDAIFLQPDSTVSYWNLAATYISKGEPDKAVEPYTFLSEKKNEVDAIIRLGELNIEKGNLYKTKFEDENGEKIEIKTKIESIDKKVSKETVRRTLGEPNQINKAEPAKRNTPATKEEWIYSKYNFHVFFDKDLVDSKIFDPVDNINIDSTDHKAASKEYDKAIVYLEKAHEAAKEADKKQEILNIITRLYTINNKLDIAIANYEKLAANDPNNKTYQYNLGVLYLNGKQFENAVSHFKKVLAIDPQDQNTLYNLYVTYNNWALQVKEEKSTATIDDTTHYAILREGIPCVQKLVELQPNNLDYLDALRALTARFKPKAELEKVYDKLKALEGSNSKNASYWDIMGKICTNLNKMTEAKQAYDKSDDIRKGL
jgi:tetratricopeptide (TPR) repeat protein